MKVNQRNIVATILAILICVTSCVRVADRNKADLNFQHTASPSNVSVNLPELLNAEVPAACEHPSGRLSNGFLGDPSSNSGTVRLRKDVLDSVNANKPGPALSIGTDESVAVAAVISCDKGGVDWPNLVVIWDKSMSLVSWIDLRNTDGHRGKVSSILLEGNEIDVKWTFAGNQDALCCATYSAQAKIPISKHTPSKLIDTTVERGEAVVKNAIDAVQPSISAPSSLEFPTQVKNAIEGVKNQGVTFNTEDVQCGGGTLDGGTFKGRSLPRLGAPITCWSSLSNGELMMFGVEIMGWNNYRINSAYVS